MLKESDHKISCISRRQLIVGGAAVVAAGGLALPLTGEAGDKAGYPWPYKKLDLDEVGERAYQSWYGNYCAMAVADGILGSLRDKVGGPYKNFPLEAVRFAHGGTVGWGTLCGTLFGAGISTSLVAGIDDGDSIINDVVAWYSAEYLPRFKPKKPKLAENPELSRSGSPLCHVSVNKWMKKTGHDFKTSNRKDRCARLAADIAMHTAGLLNAWAEDEYEPTHGSQMKTHNMTAQNNCLDCHGS